MHVIILHYITMLYSAILYSIYLLHTTKEQLVHVLTLQLNKPFEFRAAVLDAATENFNYILTT